MNPYQHRLGLERSLTVASVAVYTRHRGPYRETSVPAASSTLHNSIQQSPSPKSKQAAANLLGP